MIHWASNDEAVKAYLLGKLPAGGKRRELELILMTDDVFLQRLELLEDELIEDYLDKMLPPDDARSFEEFFLIDPERRERLIFTQYLKSFISSIHNFNSTVITGRRGEYDTSEKPVN